jgi:phosphomannomutase
VGAKFTERVFRDAGFTGYHVVPSQAEPDGRFPSLTGGVSPNPEDLRALDAAEALGREIGAELVLAHDPDADRLAVSVPAADRKSGYRPLTGNQIGLILADALLCEDQKRGESTPALVAQSLVSSPMLERIATRYGARSERTLTGFKWVWNAGLELSQTEGVRYIYGYEEALGYSIGPIVRDKDGVSAALVFAEIVAELAEKGQTVFDRLEELYRRDGLWFSLQHSINVSGPTGQEQIRTALSRLRENPPKELAGRQVTGVTDFSVGAEQRRRWLPAQNLIELTLGTSGRCLARPSGTEPKLKFYVDLCVDVAPSEDLWVRESELAREAEALKDAVLAHVGL